LLNSTSNPRLGGCTLGGAIAVTAYVNNAVTVVHAPLGCVHQTFSMYHAMLANASITSIPVIITSNLTDNDVIFGGERALRNALDSAASRNTELIFVISSCIPETIGDNCDAICKTHPESQKIIYIPTSGFLGGKAKDGENMALVTIAKTIEASEAIPLTAALIGEKNLESEIEENYQEVSRLLGLLGIRIIVRFCHHIGREEMNNLGKASFFIARDNRVSEAGKQISAHFHRPLVEEYPSGLAGEIRFLREAGNACNLSEEIIEEAIRTETKIQNEMLEEFEELRGMKICIRDEPFEGTYAVAKEVMERLEITDSLEGRDAKLPFYLPIGVAGIRKMLYLWRREKRKEMM